MTSESLRAGGISEVTIKNALTKARGDIFLASSYLSVATRELDRYIRASNELQLFVGALDKVKSEPAYDAISNEQFQKELERRVKGYKLEAIDIIYEIATMKPEEDGIPLTAAQQDVRLKAAIQLRGNSVEANTDGGQLTILQELNKQYIETAPRIKSIRAVQIEYEDKS